MVTQHQCVYCFKSYTRADSLTRHKKVCAEVRTAALTAQLAAVQTRLDIIEHRTTAGPITVTNNIANATVNNVTNVVNNVTIAPWGAPLQLTDADVEAALASIPGVAGTPAMPEVVAALMELVKRAHMPEAARNVYLNPRRGDQALAQTAAGGWAAMPLTEATAVLFDGASARIAVPTARRRVNALQASVPVQYRADKALAVQLGLRPMEAHLANMVPGGPGPLLLESVAAIAMQAAKTAPASAATQPAAEQIDATRAVALIAAHPAAGGVTAEWLAEVTTAAGVSPAALVRALRQASSAGICGMAEWQAIMRLQRDIANSD
jgi:hypothetical protein